MDIAVAGVGAAVAMDDLGLISHASLTLASVAPTPLVAARTSERMIGKKPSEELFVEAGRSAAAEAKPISDTRGSADYRRHIVSVLTKRALQACVAEIES